MRALELKVPPVAVVLVTGSLMAISASRIPAASLAIPLGDFLAIALALVGAITCSLGVLAFRSAGTTVNPLNPERSSSLVRSGIYKISRNPMYLGFLFVLAGWAIYLSNAVSLLFVALFVIYMNVFQIEPEERALRSLFGQEFAEYMSRVRRWC